MSGTQTMARVTPIEEQQLRNLRDNHAAHAHTAVPVDVMSDEQGITIEKHDRGMGRIAYYAMIEDELGRRPIAYCVGQNARKIMHDRAGERPRFIISSTFVHPAHRRCGVGLTLYRSIVGDVHLLISDWDLSEGATALWERLRMELPYERVMVANGRYFARHHRPWGL